MLHCWIPFMPKIASCKTFAAYLNISLVYNRGRMVYAQIRSTVHGRALASVYL
jgi:hypothetical protein